MTSRFNIRISSETYTDHGKIVAGRRYVASLLTPQHDVHILAHRSFIQAYGSAEGYHRKMAAKARSNAEMMQTEKGRDFIAKRNAGHAEWRASRAGLPF